MTDIELLPLPDELIAHIFACYHKGIRNYARAVAEHNVAAKDAEIEALRAEREVIGAEAVKYADKSGRLEAKVDRLAKALRSILHYIEEGGYGFEHTCERVARGALRDHDQEVGNG